VGKLAESLPLIALGVIVAAAIVGMLTVSLALRKSRKLRIARDLIVNDLRSRKLTMTAFETIRRRIDPSYSDEFLRSLPIYFPKELRRAKLAGGRPGLARIVGENEVAPPETLEEALQPWERRVDAEVSRIIRDRVAAQSISTLIGMADQAIADATTDPSQARDTKQVEWLLNTADSLAEETLREQPESTEVLISQATVRKRKALLITGAQRQQQRESLLREAIDLCSRALQLDPGSERAFYNRACYRALKGEDPALITADMKKAIELLPENKRLFASADEHDIDNVRKRPEIVELLTGPVRPPTT
jgi:hypothetical protein